jgi:hypothetical protein
VFSSHISCSIQYAVRTLTTHIKDKLGMISLAFRYRSLPSIRPITSLRVLSLHIPPTFTFLSCAKRNISYRFTIISTMYCESYLVFTLKDGLLSSRRSSQARLPTLVSRQSRCCCQCHTSSFLPLRQLQMLLHLQISMFCMRSGVCHLRIG